MNTSTVGDVLGRGIAFPPRIGPDGRVAWSEGEPNIREAIRIVLMTIPGERLRRPSFGAGLDRFLFEPNTTSTRRVLEDRITRAVVSSEPRVALESVDVDEDPVDPSAAVATITFRIVATEALVRVTASISVGG